MPDKTFRRRMAAAELPGSGNAVSLTTAAIHASTLLLALLQVACAASTSTWRIELAEEKYSAGKMESALRHTERAIQADYDRPDERSIALHIAVLRELGRHAEADAFREFMERRAAAEDMYEAETNPSWIDCTGRQSGAGLVRS